MLNHLTFQRANEWHTKNNGVKERRWKWKFTFKTDDPAIAEQVFAYLASCRKPFKVDYWGEETVIQFSETYPERADEFDQYFRRYNDGIV